MLRRLGSIFWLMRHVSSIEGFGFITLGGKIRISRKNKIKVKGRAYFGPGCYLGSNLNIEGDLLVGPSVYFVGGDHKLLPASSGMSYFDSGRAELKTTTIEKNVWIGANSVIMSGVILREGTVIAAGSVITKDTLPYTIYGSSKQFVIKKIDN